MGDPIEERFERDWAEEDVRRPVLHSTRASSPQLRSEADFFVSSVRGMPGAAEFMRAYNALLDDKVARLGVPEWAPGRRRLTFDEAREFIDNPLPPSLSQRERDSAQFLRQECAPDGSRIVGEGFVPGKRLVVVLRSDARGNELIDVLDLRTRVFMQRLAKHPGH